MKKLIALLLVLVMVLSLVACGAKSKKITLRMIDTLASESRTASIQKIIDDYQALNPNVTIELISPPTEGADQKVQQMLMSDEQLDIIDTGNGFQTCLNNGWIQPLNKYLEGWEGLETMSDVAMSRATLSNLNGDTMWLLPYGLYQKLLFYRTDLLADAGIEVPETWTFENLYEICKAVTDPEKGVYGLAFRGGERGCFCYDRLLYTYLPEETWLGDENYTFFNKDGSSIFGTQEATDALEWYKMFWEECCPPDSITWGFTEMVQGFVSGTCAVLVQDNDCIPVMESSLDPSVWGVGNMPIGPTGDGCETAGYGGWAMTAKTEYPEQVADFLKFLSSPENNGYFAQINGVIPIHTTTLETNEYFSSGAYTVFNKMNEMGNFRISTSEGLGYAWPEAMSTRDEYMQSFLTGKITADDLLGYWDSSFNAMVAEQGKLWEK